MPYTFYDSEVLEIIDETESVKRFVLDIPGPEPFSFKAGQFVMLDLPIESRITTRSYSIASAPGPDSRIELLVVLKPGGAGTEYLFHKVRKGSRLKVSKALGKFCLPDTLDREICFICTGTGIAPFRSMILDLIHTGRPHQGIHLLFGTRHYKDILYRQEWEENVLKLGHFDFTAVLSRETAPIPGTAKGYVHEVYEGLFQDRREASFYLCGWSEMLKEARQRLANMGYGKEHIHFEPYD